MDDTRTRFWAAMPASRSANSKEVSRSLCFPTPLVRKMRLGTMSFANLHSPKKRVVVTGSSKITHENVTVV